jgi:D-tyrosyl-tRNA(Tyr) deacylase
MRAVIQRVTSGSVTVIDPPYEAAIGCGLVVLLGVMSGDTAEDVEWIAGKIARLRIFADDHGKMNRSVQDVQGSVLIISQFTLAGRCEKGNRPSFVDAADPSTGQTLYEAVIQSLSHSHGLPTKTGVFGASMAVELVNDGPVTIVLEGLPRPESSS